MTGMGNRLQTMLLITQENITSKLDMQRLRGIILHKIILTVIYE